MAAIENKSPENLKKIIQTFVEKILVYQKLPLKQSTYLLCVNFCHVADQVNNFIGVTPFIIIPSDKLDKVIV